MKETKEEIKSVTDEISAEISSSFSDAERQKNNDISTGFKWSDREDLFYGIYKGADEKTKSNYSTGELQSLVLDSACRVMAQMPTGRFEGIKDDKNIAGVIAANLLYHEYILPNANSGGDFFTKQRQANLYSKVYGKMIAFVDYLKTKAYTGPDLTLVHPRRFFPQPGKYSIRDMDWCFVTTLVTKEWLGTKAKNSPKIWKKEIVEEIDASSKVSPNLYTSKEQKNSSERKDIVLVNHFTKDGDWTIFEQKTKKIIIQEKDYWPGIPLIEKRTIPVLDRFWDLCDYERGETPQKSIDALVRKYLEAVDKSINPVTIVDPEAMVMSSVNEDNKFWFAKEGKERGPRVLENAPQGLATFQSTYQIMKANLMSLSATTDTSISSGVDVGFGKTPEALKMQGAREGARDSWDRYMQERFLEDTANMMMAVASKRGMDEVKIKGIEAALEKISTIYPQKELDKFQNGVISKELLENLQIRYKVDEGSTARRDDAGEKTLLFLERIMKNQVIQKDLADSGKKINWGEVVKRMAIDNGIQDWDKILVSAESPNSIPGIGDEGGTVNLQNQESQIIE